MSDKEEYGRWLESNGLEDSCERYEQWLEEVWQEEYEAEMQSQWEKQYTEMLEEIS
jgi:hypothetical protein